MPKLERSDGTQLHFEVEGGEGPPVVLASYWNWSPGVWGELLSDLGQDHVAVTYHLRGTGESSRTGPYDMETDLADLEAVVDAVGGPAFLIGTADSSNRAAKLAARRPELIAAVISFGTAPFARSAFEGQEGMAASTTVVDAFAEMLENNYRGGMRNLMEATNPQANEQELRDRVDRQVAFCPAEAAVGRFRAWADDDPRAEARSIGGRLWIFAAADVAGPWLPPREAMARITRETLPQAKVVRFEGSRGAISAPHETAEAVRRVTAPLRAGAAGERK